ncbi:MAG: VanW family protein [Firmicutes bacterium]|nr:VanW family protein [Bacillota bacterium]
MYFYRFLYLLVPAVMVISVSGCGRVVTEPAAAPGIVETSASSGPTATPRQRVNPLPSQPEPARQTRARSLAVHETEFSENEKNRNTNIMRAAEAIDGHIVQPGAVFSYNKTVGPTNEKRGYKKSTIFVDGEKTKGVGGGVCQVSTTLFNAAEEAGMTILERHDHSRPVEYAKSGEEAATSYGGIDFKFKNEKPYPIIINAAVNNGKIRVAISAV